MDETQADKVPPSELPRSEHDAITIIDKTRLSDSSASDDGDDTPTLEPQTPLGRFGDYELIAEIGRGGMGVVYKARHVHLNRVVALKMILGGALAHADDRQRFDTEAEAAAQLQHPNIVALYEIAANDNQPFFSLEFIDGVNLAVKVKAGPLENRDAARYTEIMARAVHYAHGRGVIHRDLKPANILLDEHDQPKITDFGLAKLLKTDSGQTRTGAVLGTPSYMAPEQAAARKDIGPSCDVYSLGAILYELLTGRPPFRGETALATLTLVAEQDPILPRLLHPTVDRDLETICLKCLEKDPGRRYETANELADDLKRYVHGEPISARRLGPIGRAIKWCRRKPAAAALLALAVVVILAFGVFNWMTAQQERALREQATLNAKGMRFLLYLAEIRQAQTALQDADNGKAKRLLAKWHDSSLRDWEWYFLADRLQGKSTLDGHIDRATAIAFSPTDDLIATSGGEIFKPGEIKLWQFATGKLLHTFSGHTNLIASLAFSRDGRLLASGSEDRTVRIWDPKLRRELLTLQGHTEHVSCVVFHPKTNLLAAVGGNRDVRIYKIDNKDKVSWEFVNAWRAHQGRITAAAFSPGGTLLATVGVDGQAILWNPKTGNRIRSWNDHNGELHCVSFDATGGFVAVGGGPSTSHGEVKIWNTQDGSLSAHHFGLANRILSVAYSRGGHFAAGDNGGLIRLWSPRSNEPKRIRGDSKMIYAVAFHPKGDRLASAGRDGKIRIWNTTGGAESLRFGGLHDIQSFAWSPDNATLALAGGNRDDSGAVQVWNLKTGEKTHSFSAGNQPVLHVAICPDGRRLAAACTDHVIRIFDLSNPTEPPLLLTGHGGRVCAVAFGPRGVSLVSASGDETVRVWDVRNGTTKRILTGHSNEILTVCFGPNGRYIASGGYDKTVCVWDLNGADHFVLKGHTGSVNAVAFNPTGSQIASASSDRTIRVWDLALRKEYLKLEGSPDRILTLAYHPNGRRLVSAGQEDTVRLWDLVTHQQILALQTDQHLNRQVGFSPNGRYLTCVTRLSSVLIWDATTAAR